MHWRTSSVERGSGGSGLSKNSNEDETPFFSAGMLHSFGIGLGKYFKNFGHRVITSI